jgi:phosphate transport system substrate-binding protein
MSLMAAAIIILSGRFSTKSYVVTDAQAATTLQGTGATFPAPLYQQWFTEYNKAHPDVQINYQALGSAVPEGVVLLPMTAGAVVLAYNLPDLSQPLKLSREAYVGIFLGKITQWNDPVIAKANPGVTLPDTKIQPVVRSDGSGTTFVFTSHLSAISPAWKSGPGAGKSVNFPSAVAGKGNPGVAALIKETPGAIGYVEFGYAMQTHMPMAILENKSGKYVKADLQAGKAALASVQLPPNLRAWITDPEAQDAYPIVTYTWLLCYKKYQDAEKWATLKSVIQYGLAQGQTFSAELGYIPLPPNVVDADNKALGQIS